jgi:hypothetical protein
VLIQSLDFLFQRRQPEGHQVKILQTNPFTLFGSLVQLLKGDLGLALTHGDLMQNLMKWNYTTDYGLDVLQFKNHLLSRNKTMKNLC